MSQIVRGVVKDGRIVPDSPLPEGAKVEVRLGPPRPEFTPEEAEEFEAWNRASDRALRRFEEMLENESDAPG